MIPWWWVVALMVVLAMPDTLWLNASSFAQGSSEISHVSDVKIMMVLEGKVWYPHSLLSASSAGHSQ